MRLDGKVAFVSGGASGIGEAIVTRFAAEGAKVFFGDVDEAKGEAVAHVTGARFVKLDVRSEPDWVAACDMLQSESGKLDVLVNNAGIVGSGAMVEDMELADWQLVMSVNVDGVMLGCKHGARLMLRNPDGPSGSIINMSSNSGLLATPGAAYSTSKGAVRLMTKAIAADFAYRGISIRCNSIHPAAVDTPIFDRFRQGSEEKRIMFEEELLMMIPMGRIGRVEEIASMALFLASDESSFSTGAEFVVDGGSTASLPRGRTTRGFRD